jgi:penicillin-binding protein 1A
LKKYTQQKTRWKREEVLLPVAEKKVPLDQKKGRSQKENHKSSDRSKQSSRKGLKYVALTLGLLLLAGGGALAAVGVSYIMAAPEFDPEALKTVQTSYIYDNQDIEVAALHGEENRIYVPLAEIPDHVQEAFLAIEDERFYSHFGFDVIGFSRALLVNLQTRSFSQGASTISQQLAQNAFLGQEKRIPRKVQEIWLSLQLERQYSKKEILELYLNRIYFGNGAYGVEAAAQTYFDKSVGELEIAEAALLAALVRAPNYYDPFVNEEAGINRMKQVLGNMQRLDYITETEAQDALAAEFVFGEPPTFAYPYPYFIDHVVHVELVKTLMDIFSLDSRDEAYDIIYTGGLRVYTSMDTALQAHMDEVLSRDELYPETVYIDTKELGKYVEANEGRIPADLTPYIDEENGVPQPQSAMVLADPQTGAIWALGGGRGYDRNVLRRYESYRQPGSAIKPILTYAPAIEEGLLGAGSTLDDAPLIGPNNWFPENYHQVFRGMVTVRTALADSLNLPAVRAYQQLGLQKGAEYAQRFGLSNYDPDSDRLGPAWTLGAREVTALDMAQAFGVLANNGVKIDMYTIERIEDRSGRIIYEQTVNPEQVLSPQATFIVNDIQKDVVTRTTARNLQPGRPMAAKTGTTDERRDVYLAAYAPNVVTTFWMGYDVRNMGRIRDGWNYTTAFTREVLNEVFKTLPVEQFPTAPQGVVRMEVCTKSGLLPTEHCREAESVRADYFLTNHVPRVECDMHVTLDICKVSDLLAGEFCPDKDVRSRSFFNRPDYITTDGRWPGGAGRKPQDAEENPPKDSCDKHTSFSGELTLTAAVQGNDILLEWSYRGARMEGFLLYRAIQGETEATLLAELGRNKDSYLDNDLELGKTYEYTLYAAYEDDSRSSPATVSVELSGKPGTPNSLTGKHVHQNDTHSIVLSWVPADNRANEFIISRRTGPGSGQNFKEIDRVSGTATTYTDTTDLNQGTTYSYYIVARNEYGLSEPSEVVSVQVPDSDDNDNDNGNGNNNFFNIFNYWPTLQQLFDPFITSINKY